MNEKFNPAHEQHEQRTPIMDAAHELPAHTESLEQAERAQHRQLEAARSAVEEESAEQNPLEQLKAAEQAATEAAEPALASPALLVTTLQRQLTDIRRKLPPAERALSRVIHQPAIRATSEVAGRTISRPSGLLGGGIVAFLGSSSYLYLAKHVGFQYNYLLFAMFFVGGFVVGLALELIVWLAFSRRHTA